MNQNQHFIHTCKTDTCAITGASAFFLGIKDSVIVVNGSKFCYLQMMHHLERSFFGPVKNRMFCTNLQENGIIYGNADNLKAVLEHIKENLNPSIICLQNNCAASLIGDDLEGIAAVYHFSCPVIVLDCGGIQGSFQEGFNKAAEQFFSLMKVVDEDVDKEYCSVNIIGATEACYNYRYDKQEILKLLSLAGIKVLHFIPDEINIEELHNLKQACLNVVLYSELGTQIAKVLEKKFGIPYIQPDLPYGIQGSHAWLCSILTALPVPDRKNRLIFINSFFDDLKKQVKSEFEKLKKEYGEIWIDQIHIAGNFSVVWGLAEALRKECVNYDAMHLTIYNNCKNRLLEEGLKNRYYTVSYEFHAEKIVNDKRCFLFGSFNEHMQMLSCENKGIVGYCCISYPVNDYISFAPYMGLEGYRHLMMQLWNYCINNSYLLIAGK